MKIFAATSNRGKLREFRESGQGAGITVLELPGLEAMPEPAEDAHTFTGNAELKAVGYSKLARGMLVMADDSGLEVEALGGDPGVYSARFADRMGFEPETGMSPTSSRDERNNRCLLAMLAEVNRSTEGRAGRHARFVCALAVARDGQVLLRADGEVEGEILDAPRGENGFGYDTLFFIPRMGLTLAELGTEEKWAISHRGGAVRALLEQVRSSSL